MGTFITALVPIIALIFIGYGLKRTKFLSQDAWSGMEKLTYFILFPALLIKSLGSQSLDGAPWIMMLLVVSGTLIVAALALILINKTRWSVNGATFTSIFQGGVRFNTYIALAIALGFFGEEGLAFGSIVAGFMVVIVNVFSISVFVACGKTKFKGVFPFIRQVMVNPLIIASAIGWFLSLSGIGLPGVTEDIFEIIGRAALPFGLLAVGASLRLDRVGGHIAPIVISSIVQFGLKPIVAMGLILLTGVSGIAAGVLVITFMTPTAPSSYILARQLGGDTEAMSSIVTFQTLLAFLVMPVIAFLLLK